MASDIGTELNSMVQNIVDELEAAVSGSLYDVDGNATVIDDMDEWKKAEYAKEVDAFKASHSPIARLKQGTRYVESAFDPDLYGSFEEFMEDEIGTADDIDEPDPISLDEYFRSHNEPLDLYFEVDTQKNLNGGRMQVTAGGPSIWIADDEVRGYWGSTRVEISLDSETKSAMWDWFEGQWDTVK